MTTLRFDEDNLADTAAMVRCLNEYVADMTVPQLVEHMRHTANASLGDTLGFVSTAGYMLTAFRNLSGEVEVRASVTTYNVRKGLERLVGEQQ